MAIVPGVEPVQGLNQQVEPFQPLPVKQISASTQRLTKRLQNTRSELDQLMLDMAEQEVIPEEVGGEQAKKLQQAFGMATKGVRDRLQAVAESDKLYNKMPQVRREARRFAEIAKGFERNKKAIQSSLENLNEAEGLSSKQREVKKRQILQNAAVGLTEDGQVDPRTISGAESFKDAQDPRDYLDERLSSMKKLTKRDYSTDSGAIVEKERSYLGKNRLFNQGMKELGFQKNEDGELVRTGEASPGVERWLRNERDVAHVEVAREMRSEGKNPQENQEEFTRKVNENLNDKMVNMVRNVAGRHVEGDVDADITVKSDPRVDGTGSGSGIGDGDSRSPVLGPGVSLNDKGTKAIRDKAVDDFVEESVRDNDNIEDMDQYRNIGETIRSNQQVSSTASTPVGGPGIPLKDRESGIEKAREKYGNSAVEAYKRVKSRKENVEKSVADWKLNRQAYQLPVDATKSNEISRLMGTISPNQFESVNKNLANWQKEEIISNPDSFTPLRYTRDGKYMKIRLDDVSNIDLDSWTAFEGIPSEGDEIILKLSDRELKTGSGEQTLSDRMAEYIGGSAGESIKQNRKVPNERLDEWTPTRTDSNIEVKLGKPNRNNSLDSPNPEISPRYRVRFQGEDVTFGDVANKVIDRLDQGEKLKESDRREMAKVTANMAKAANLIPGMEGAFDRKTFGRLIADWADENTELSEEKRKIVESIMDRHIPAEDPGEAVSWGELLRDIQK